MINISNNIINGIMSLFGISSIWFTLKTILAEQLPNIPDLNQGTSLIAAIGSFTAALMAALLRQGNTIKNIDENIDKNVAITKQLMNTMAELLETHVKIIKKDDEKFDTLLSLLKKQDEKYDMLISILKSSNEKSDAIIATLKKSEEKHDSLVAKIVSMGEKK